MKILLIGALDSPIKKDSIGGTEMWTYSLAQELIKCGHSVDLLAAEGSHIDGRVISCGDPSIFREKDNSILRANYFALSVNQALIAQDIEKNYDLIHLSVFNYFCYLPILNRFSKPVVVTIHGYNRLWHDEAKVLLEWFSNPTYVFVSESFANNWPKPSKSRTIFNGIKYQDFSFSDKLGDYYFWIGRISPEKGIMDAINFAKNYNQKLIIAGPIGNQEFYDSQIAPLLSDQTSYVGQVNFEQKNNYYKNARALLFPISLPEPMPLVVLESLSCGTPVITYDIDPMNDIIINGQNGFVVAPGDIDQMYQASTKIGGIDRNNCLNTIVHKYNFDQMVSGYVKLYSELIVGGHHED